MPEIPIRHLSLANESKVQFNCYFCNSSRQSLILHDHDYYEMYLTLTEGVSHIVNGSTQAYPARSLVFIRAHDMHLHVVDPQLPQEYVCLSFSRCVLEKLFAYLAVGVDGAYFPAAQLLEAQLPPSRVISKTDMDRYLAKLESLHLAETDFSNAIALELRLLLTDMFVNYFGLREYNREMTNIPYWLEKSYQKMRLRKNYFFGITRMTEISGKTKEHLSRSMKKYYGITVSEYINELRLNYIANMLMISQTPIIDIIYDTGFNSLDHCYRLFKERFGSTPLQFRKAYMAKMTEEG